MQAGAAEGGTERARGGSKIRSEGRREAGGDSDALGGQADDGATPDGATNEDEMRLMSKVA